MTELAKTLDAGKPDMTLLPYEGLVGAVRGFEDGIRPGKYERNDWRKGMAYSKCVAAIIRHCFCIVSGQRIDSDSGLPHAYHIAARGLMLATYFATGTGIDDLTKGEE